jgi:hypothetical protein
MGFGIRMMGENFLGRIGKFRHSVLRQPVPDCAEL